MFEEHGEGLAVVGTKYAVLCLSYTHVNADKCGRGIAYISKQRSFITVCNIFAVLLFFFFFYFQYYVKLRKVKYITVEN